MKVLESLTADRSSAEAGYAKIVPILEAGGFGLRRIGHSQASPDDESPLCRMIRPAAGRGGRHWRSRALADPPHAGADGGAAGGAPDDKRIGGRGASQQEPFRHRVPAELRRAAASAPDEAPRRACPASHAHDGRNASGDRSGLRIFGPVAPVAVVPPPGWRHAQPVAAPGADGIAGGPIPGDHPADRLIIDRRGAQLHAERHGNGTSPRSPIGGFLAWLVLTVLIPLAIQAASAETFRPNLTQYGHLSWRLLDGAVAGAVFGIAQTKDGYLWIATDGGLERFDGRQFQPWTIPGNQVAYSLLAARDGSLWVGTGRGVVHVDHGRSDLVKNLEARTNAFVEERDGSLWLVRTRIHDRSGPLCHMKGGSVRCYGAADGIQCPFGATLTQDRDGRLWFGGASGVCTWRAGESRFFPVQNKSLANLEAVTAVAARPDGSILAGYIRPGADLGLQSMVSGKSTPFRADGIDGAALAVTDAARGPRRRHMGRHGPRRHLSRRRRPGRITSPPPTALRATAFSPSTKTAREASGSGRSVASTSFTGFRSRRSPCMRA